MTTPPLSARAVYGINAAEELLVAGAPYYGVNAAAKLQIREALAHLRDAREALYGRPSL